MTLLRSPSHSKPPQNIVLVLDAMGVIFSVGDDVADLLVPFIHERNGESDRQKIELLYREASLGRVSAGDFWQAVGLDPTVEDDYLDRHRLTPGALDFLRAPPPDVSAIWCLSNDVSEWSRKLRDRFSLATYIRGFVVSGDVGARKPDAAIFHRLFANIAAETNHAILVDDRSQNLDVARSLGMGTIQFSAGVFAQAARHCAAADFQELRKLLSSGDRTPWISPPFAPFRG